MFAEPGFFDNVRIKNGINSAVILCLCSLAGYCHAEAAKLIGQRIQPREMWLIPRPDWLRLISLGFDDLAADLLWLQLVQYAGDSAARAKDNGCLTEDMVESILAADPHFIQAYWFAAFLIGGDQNQPAVADRILRKGIEVNSNNWYLPFIAGLNEYLYAHDEQAAAHYYRMAARFPQAPNWLERQAKILEARIPSEVKNANVWQTVYDSATSAEVKQRARDNLRRIWIRIWKVAPTKSIRERAAQKLNELGFLITGPSPDAKRSK
jgi:hypothetical protein